MKQPEHEPYDSSVLRWLIPSNSDSRSSYLVQIEPPECQCRHWNCEVGPKLRRGETPRQMCAHYVEAEKRFFAYAKWAFWNFEEKKKQNG